MTNDELILEQANEAILEQPFEFKVAVNAKGLHKLLIKLGLKPKDITISLKPTVLGARVRYSKALLGVKLEEADLNRPEAAVGNVTTVDYTDRVALAIASAIHNKNEEPPKWLVRTILEHFSAEDLLNMAHRLKAYVNTKDFLHSIILLTGMSLNEREEIIAPDTSTSGKSSAT